jgi:PAS domain-containing protein
MLIMQNLKDSELCYRRLLEAAQDGILILDAKTGMIEDVNPFLINMLCQWRAHFFSKLSTDCLHESMPVRIFRGHSQLCTDDRY